MILKQVQLTNFRCFHNLSVQLHPRLNIFVGKNGEGKTAILDGIATGLGKILTELGVSGIGFKETDLRINPRGEIAPFVQIQLETVNNLTWHVSKKSKRSQSVSLPKENGFKQLKAFLKTLVTNFDDLVLEELKGLVCHGVPA